MKETELRAELRGMRAAIDEYKRYSDAGLITVELGTDGYPPELETLVEGVDVVGQIDKKIRFLRRIPIDPMTGDDEWGLRSYQDEPDSTSWGGENVFDVYSLSGGTGLDRIPYSQW
jgi:general secretion pathway protein G